MLTKSGEFDTKKYPFMKRVATVPTFGGDYWRVYGNAAKATAPDWQKEKAIVVFERPLIFDPVTEDEVPAVNGLGEEADNIGHVLPKTSGEQRDIKLVLLVVDPNGLASLTAFTAADLEVFDKLDEKMANHDLMDRQMPAVKKGETPVFPETVHTPLNFKGQTLSRTIPMMSRLMGIGVNEIRTALRTIPTINTSAWANPAVFPTDAQV